MLARLLLMFLACCALLRAGESLSVSFTPTDAGGEYTTLYVQAVWVETSSGDFVKTIGDWSSARRNRLSRWQAMAGTADTDAIIGATIMGYSTPTTLRATWDLTYKGGAAASDGAYKIWFETANIETPVPQYTSTSRPGVNLFSITVTKDGVPRLTPQTVVDPSGKFLNVAWTYTGRAPVIAASGQPAAQSVVAGSTASFSVTASGGSLSYQWQRDGVAISGANAASYTTAPTVLGDSGAVFTCVVTNGDGGTTSGGTTTSNGAALTVTGATAAPSIVTAPSNATVSEGQPAAFTVIAGGTAPLTYQWQKNGVNIGGATAAGYAIPATVRATDHGAVYRCVVSGTGAPATSAGATLIVNRTPVAITAQTIRQTVNLIESTSVTLNVVAVGTPPLTYQWKKAGANIVGATSASYTKTGLVTGDAGNYTCAVTGVDAAGAVSTVTTATIPLAVGIKPTITVQPTSPTVAMGGTASLSVTATGASGYTWFRNGLVAGFGNPFSLTATYTRASCNGDTWYCRVGNGYGEAISSTVTLTVTGTVAAGTAPTISLQPTAAFASENIGWQTDYFVIANGTAPLSYQWRKNGVAIPGATAANYRTPGTTPADVGPTYTYSVVVTNGSGSVTSSNGVLTIHNPPTFTTQPVASQAKLAGQTATLSVTAVGTPTLMYKWYKNGVATGVTTASYTTPALTAADDGATYFCIVYNRDTANGNKSYADSYSTEAVVSVLAITGQPQAQTVTVGQTASFSVTATGSGLSYQWRKNGTAIGGATSASYTTPATVAGDNGAVFTCVVTNAAGSVTSSGATLTVNVVAIAPTVTGHPAALTRIEGLSASFTVTATGTAPLTYQWRRNGTAIGGATSATYAISSVALADNGASFTCVVTNGAGSATSNAAILTVNPAPPVITTQPSAQTVNVGQTATFTVAVTGSAPLTYQWRKNGTVITGATAASYTTPAAVLGDDGASFTCVISNAAGTVTTSAAVLTVQAPPVITVDPVNATVAAGATATFSVTATGSPTLTYQWRRDGSPITGATSASYTTPVTTIAYDGAVYTCLVTNAYGSATSGGATLTVQAAPTITVQPAASTVTVPATATFSITATGSPTLTYQWRKNGSAIGGATATSYTTPATVLADDGAVFTCVVSNSFGNVTSSGAILTAHAAPAITTQPTAQTVASGATATFSLVATGTATLTYQWRKNGSAIGGATATSYTTPATVFADDGASYTCVVSNAYGSVTSSAAILTVQAPPSLTAQPVAQTVVSGATATFSVTATGSATLTYQWRKNGTNIPAATSAAYTTPATTFADNAASFTCIVSNGFGNVTSTGATLTVQAAPTITTQPTAQSVDGGQTATFSVVATGSPTLTYQWRKNGSNISGATSASYTTPATGLADSGASYTCRITNAFGNVTSAGAILTVRVVPTITTQPVAQSVTTGLTATFSLVATGSPALTYQWSRDATPIGGATAASYTTPATVLGDDGAVFTCVVTNAYGSITSAGAILSVSASVTPAAIATQPVAQTVLEGQSATFTVVASGTAPLAYQWKLGGTAIVGATAASYTTPATVLADSGGLYACDVSNAGGSASSIAVALTVNPAPPTITADPADLTVAAGATATFSVSATGSATLTYQWRRNGSTITGATSASYTTPATVFADDGALFTCRVSNGAGNATSQAATLTVQAGPAISVHPASQSVGAGATATFSVTATGSAPLAYQWRRNGTSIGGANAASYTTPATVIGDDGDVFTCVVGNPFGSVTSAGATLTVTAAPVITAQPVAQTVAAGATATFTVTASGSGLSYQWRRGGLAIVGATSASYTTAATVAGDDGAQFTCVVSNGFGSATSIVATLTVTVPPAITTAPVAQSVQAGQTATFSVTATGSAPLAYQWRKDGVAIGGATAATYTTPATVLADDGAIYTCAVSNPYGSATSGGATLSVQAAATGQAFVTFTPSAAGGGYAPAHVLAVWIETAGGTFVRTIGDWSAIRRDSLTQWQAKAGSGDTDAVMGATRVALTPVNNLAWDLTDAASGNTVADGAYTLWIELVDTDLPPAGTASVSGARRTSVPFSISGGAVLPVGPLTQAGFSGISISPTLVAVPVPAASNAGAPMASCGSGGLYGLLIASCIGLGSLRRRRQRCG